jgi:hypothetical protein
MDASAKPYTWSRIIVRTNASRGPPQSPAVFDACASFIALCSLWHDTVGYPAAARVAMGCTDAASVSTWVGSCTCGSAVAGTGRALGWLVDAVLADALIAYTYVAPPVAPFDLVINSNPSRPCLAPAWPLPGDD